MTSNDTLHDTFDTRLITTAFELPGHRIATNLGVVRGIVVRSRSIFGTIGAAIQTLFGGNISLYADLCEKARADAFKIMLDQAEALGANAIIGMRYDANEVTSGVTEVLAYGTAVVAVCATELNMVDLMLGQAPADQRFTNRSAHLNA